VKTDLRLKLVELIEKKDISIAKLARLADMCYPTLYNYLNGNSNMRSDNLEKLFNILEKLN